VYALGYPKWISEYVKKLLCKKGWINKIIGFFKNEKKRDVSQSSALALVWIRFPHMLITP
jgi:hypothetical protein